MSETNPLSEHLDKTDNLIPETNPLIEHLDKTDNLIPETINDIGGGFEILGKTGNISQETSIEATKAMKIINGKNTKRTIIHTLSNNEGNVHSTITKITGKTSRFGNKNNRKNSIYTYSSKIE